MWTSLAVLAAVLTGNQTTSNWPAWRGPLGTGAAPSAKPPTEWNATKNIRWKTPLPGRGHSTPIVWGNRIFVTAAIPIGEKLKPRYSGRPGAHDNLPVTHKQRFVVIALDRKTGKIAWQKTLHEALPVEGAHYTASLASASAVTDGKRVFAYFGSFGLYCLDFDGNLKWKKDLGRMKTKHGHGEGASPVLYGETIAVNWDHEGKSFVAAFNTKTGKQIWKQDRDEVTSWSTPIVVVHKKTPQLIVCGTSRVRGYNLKTGKVIWECGGLSANIVASPVAANGRVYVGSSYEKRALLGIKFEGAKGDITGTTNVLWQRRRGTPYVPSPLLYRGSLYFLTHYQNILTRIDAPTGKDKPGAFRLGYLRNIYASPVAANGNVYITDRVGTTMVITDAAKPKLVAINRLDEPVNASLAVAGDELFIRGEKNLYCIGASK